MRNERRSRGEEESTLDLTPMIDVTFQLIIFFLVVSHITSQETVDLRLPDSLTAGDTPLGPERLFTVHIAQVGASEASFGWFCYGDSRPRSSDEMRAILAREAAVTAPAEGKPGLDPDGISENVVVVRCDARCPASEFGKLIELMAAVRLYKVKIAVLKDQRTN
ncbi:MAG: biopolymer transporter ExbD [Planctomycetes bacterium]|nr:biopolymer transporter ExbD [Planctomycetota bacterium]